MLIPECIRNQLRWIDTYYYFISVFSVGLLMVSSGSVVGWPSPTVPKIKAGQTPVVNIDLDVTGIGYMFFIGGIPGFVLAWVFLAFFGRKAGLLASSFLFIISWLVLVFAKTLSLIYIARLIQGTAQVLILVIAPVYVIEISQVSLREMSGFSLQFFFNSGLLLQYSMGPYSSYINLIYVNIAVSLFAFISFLFLASETPYFLYIKNYKDDAENVLRKCRKHNKNLTEYDIQVELSQMQKMIEDRKQHRVASQVKMLMLDKGARKALLITLGLTYLFVFSGISQLLMFTQTMFIKSQVPISPSLSCIFIGVSKLLGGFLLPFLVKRFGIKKMAVYSSMTCSFVMFVLALFYFLKDQGYELKQFFWAPLLLFLLYFFLATIGLAFICFHVRAEIFPPHLKPTGILLQEICMIVGLEVCSLFFTQLLHIVYVPLWFFSVSMFVSVIFIIYFVPDSRKMSLYEIQQWLHK